MKTIISSIITAILCSSLLVMEVRAQSNDPPVQPNGGMLIAAFVLSCAAVGVYLIWRVRGTLPSQTSPVTLVLEESIDGRATWTPIFTNTVVLNGTKPIEFFRDRMVSDMAFYRVRVQK